MKQLQNRINIFKDYITKKNKITGLPIEIGIELTNRCNLGCPMCAREEMVREEGTMPIEVFKKIVDEVKDYAEMIYLHGDGEPFIHKHLFDAIKYAKANGLRVGMSTNATILDERRARLLIDSKIDYLIMAVDGFSKETYEKIRLWGKYKDVKANVERFLELRKRLRSKIYAIVQIIEMDENKHEIDDFYNYWKTQSPSIVRIKSLTDLIWHSRKAVFKRPCFYIWRSCMIDWDGTVFPCCMDTNSTQKMGNVLDKPLREIWNGSSITQMRQKHIEGRQKEISVCNTCDMPQLTLGQAFAVTMMSGFTTKRVLPIVENLLYLSKSMTHRGKKKVLKKGTLPLEAAGITR